jgi:hypothetical protein
MNLNALLCNEFLAPLYNKTCAMLMVKARTKSDNSFRKNAQSWNRILNS